MARVYEERGPDTVVVHDHGDRDTAPRNDTGVILAAIAVIVLLLIIFAASRAFSGGGTVNVHTPTTTPTVTTPSR